jgi:Ca2+-binding EF-hand superfamily protein
VQRSPGGAHQLLKCFNQLDRDRSGAISPEEMRRFLATFHMDVDPPSLHAFLTALDANKDGNIDYDVRIVRSVLFTCRDT